MTKSLLILSAFLLTACGGGSATTAVLPKPPIAPAPVTPDPVQGIAEPLYPPVLSNTTCTGQNFIILQSVETEASHNADFSVSNIIDGDLTAPSRWETSQSSAEFTIELGYRHLVKELGIAWHEGNTAQNRFDIAVSEDGETFTPILTNETSSANTLNFERTNIDDSVARFVRITSYGNTTEDISAITEVAVFGCPLDIDITPTQSQSVDVSQFNLNPSLAPGDNFDLLTWALDTPRTDPDDGFSLRASERDLDNGFEDDDYFFTGADGAMVFRSTIFGAKTSANTSFTRSELREMLRRGNTSISTQGVNQNNWILDYQPDPGREVGGRGGVLRATLKIDKVTIGGSQSHTGRLVIGQIHAGSDEPIRLYYKKFPNNDKGYIFFAHEINGGDDIWKMVLGPRHTNEDNQPTYTGEPDQGIALDEIFSYEIDQSGARIDVIIRRGDLSGPIIAHQYVDMNAVNSGYDQTNVWNYFKAGAYSQNNTGESGDANGVGSDYDQVSFYYLENTHGDG